MIITDIKKTKGKMYSVYVDNSLALEIPEYILMKLNIYVGMEMTDEELGLIKNQVLISMAKSDAIKFVSFKMRTAHEVKMKLREKYTAEIIEETIDYLTQNGYLNDELYTEKFIIEKKKLGRLSKKELSYKLMEKGIKRELTEKVLGKVNYDDEEFAGKIISKMSKVKNKEEELKIRNYLYKKGFSKESIDKNFKDDEN